MSIKNFKVSIALTTYNHQDFIANCLDSILAQNVNFKYEIVIGEDKSHDNTFSIIEAYQQKFPEIIRVLNRQSNMGYTRNFDDTMRQCKGEYIAIFDGDDLMLPGKLASQVEFLDKNPEIVIVGHIMDAFENSSGKIIRTIEPWVKKERYFLEDLIKRGSFFGNSTKMFRKSAYPVNGINPNIRHIADWAVTLDIVANGEIGFIWEKLALHRVHGTSIMQQIKGTEDFNDKKLIINDFVSRTSKVNITLFKNQWAYAYMVKGIDELVLGQSFSAFKSLLKSLLINPFYSFTTYYYIMIILLPRFINKKAIPKKYFRR